MCGIVGYFGNTSSATGSAALAAISHRGPDALGHSELTVFGRKVWLGHARLSIVDLDERANQPFLSNDGQVAIVFNGEIYNHKQLRAALQRAGRNFRTTSDTEVLVEAYACFGEQFIQRLNGMFAFVLIDLARGVAFGARDSYGIKPLYYYTGPDGELGFASELRALRTLRGSRFAPDRRKFTEFLLNGFVYEPDTGLEGAFKVPPSTYFRYELASAAFTLHPYHRGSIQAGNLEAIISEQLKLEVEADVPVGLFFSGGIDSTVLAALAPRETPALFINYSDAQSDEREYSRLVARELGLRLIEIEHGSSTMTRDWVIEEFRAVAQGTEEPISDYTFSATRLLSRFARDAGYKVMLSGMGGDEFFAGYPRHWLAARWSLSRLLRPALPVVSSVLKNNPAWGKKLDRLKAFFDADDFVRAYTQLVGYFSFAEVLALTKDETAALAFVSKLHAIDAPHKDASHLKRAMNLDRHGFLSHNLTVTDKASMLESLEVRVPLLTTEAANYALSCTDVQLAKGGRGKIPLREILRKRLPHSLIDRKKVGFNPPLDAKISIIGPDRTTDLLCHGELCRELDIELIKRWIKEHFAGHRNHSYRLWQLLYFEFWLAAQR